MSMSRYPEYKDSGVAWLGDVPSNWVVNDLKRDFRVIGGSTPKSDHEAYWDGPIIWVTPSDLSKLSDFEIAESQRKITDEGLASCGTTLVPVGSIVLSTRAPIGSLAIANSELCTNQGCKALVPSQRVYSRFYAYLLSVATEELNIRGKGTTFLELSGDELGAFKVVFPPIDEQQVIAAFLDRETAKIDALVAEQEKLIALLKEKRQAVISYAVTKGLDPDVPMKDSGIEWLGEVPAHWEIKKTSHYFTAKKGSNAAQLTKEYCSTIEGEYPVYSGQTENNGVMSYINQFEFDTGVDGFLFSTTVGAKAMSVMHLKGRLSLSQNCMVIIPSGGDIKTRFYYYHFQPLFFYERGLIPEHMQASFRMEDLYQFKIGMPPLAEQSDIATFLDQETGKIDALVHQAECAIDLLKERRSALISAAVTGKIDVRGTATLEAAA